MHPLDLFKYCPKCGSASFVENDEKSKRCTDCGFVYYFNVSSATVAFILNEKEELLVCRRAKEPKLGTLDLAGGFADRFETGEEGVAREVMEETGIRIKNLKYFGSQPWPYPSGVMIGFTADYESGEIKLQEEELSAASFFHREHLPELPGKLSLARKLKDDWLEM